MAERRLPDAVIDILETPLGDDVAIPTVDPVAVHTRDEVADVSDALNTVQDTALDLAVEQAVLRRNIADSFVNLGRRNQNLLGRQLDFITELETNETDPDTLANLFRLDHLATRMRRNAESLLVLAGIEPPRKWAAPVRLTDVIRAALGEVEDYQRVTVRGVEPATIIGSAAADLAHLLAELIENALVFSPPDQTVDIRGRNRARPPHGYTLAIIDSGLGMPASRHHRRQPPPRRRRILHHRPLQVPRPLRRRKPRRPPQHPRPPRQLPRQRHHRHHRPPPHPPHHRHRAAAADEPHAAREVWPPAPGGCGLPPAAAPAGGPAPARAPGRRPRAPLGPASRRQPSRHAFARPRTRRPAPGARRRGRPGLARALAGHPGPGADRRSAAARLAAPPTPAPPPARRRAGPPPTRDAAQDESPTHAERPREAHAPGGRHGRDAGDRPAAPTTTCSPRSAASPGRHVPAQDRRQPAGPGPQPPGTFAPPWPPEPAFPPAGGTATGGPARPRSPRRPAGAPARRAWPPGSAACLRSTARGAGSGDQQRPTRAIPAAPTTGGLTRRVRGAQLPNANPVSLRRAAGPPSAGAGPRAGGARHRRDPRPRTPPKQKQSADAVYSFLTELHRRRAARPRRGATGRSPSTPGGADRAVPASAPLRSV